MSFGEAIKSVFSKYATFSGRARRSEYWYFVLFNVLFMLGFALIARVFPEAKFLTYLYLVYSLAIVIPSLAVGVRRLHDIGKRGWNMFILLIVALLNSSITVLGKSSLKIGSGVLLILAIIALALTVLFVVWLCKDSQPGENKWGPNPKEVQSENNSGMNY